MDVIVCIKQVPGTTNVKIDKETNTLIREGVEAILNPFDAYAVEEGIRIREKSPGKVTLLSMGIPNVAGLLKETLALGADEAVLLSDRAFAGSDSLATAYALSMGVRKIGAYDVILCGKQAIDGDTAQVGPSLAEKLGIPHTTCVRRIEEIRPGYIRCQRLTEEGYETIEMSLPAVITVVKEINEPRLPSIKGLIRARGAVVRVWKAEEIGADPALCGLSGSPTRVVRTFTPVHEVASEMFAGSPAEQATQLADRLFAMQFMAGR